MMSTNGDSFADLFDAEESKPVKQLKTGEKVSARIVGFGGESVFLDIGGKSEGVLNAAEITNDDGELETAVGDVIDVYFLSSKRSELLFTTTISSGASHEHLQEAWRSGIPVEGFVKAEIKGGFEITLGGNVRAFCPYSQIGLRRVESNEIYLDQHMQFRITRFESGGRNIVVSARDILEEERELQKETLKENLSEGDIVEGEITSIQKFGAFVDIGGIDGLIPISEISWSRVDQVDDYLHVGQNVSVAVKQLDWENDRISLSLKETLADPWESDIKQFPEGSSHIGQVAKLAQFGAFVTLAPGIDGLVHVSKLGGGRKIHHPREVLEVGQDLEVSIESIDLDEKRISLAPTDYTAPEDNEEAEKEVFHKFQKTKKKGKKKENLGSLGELLQAKLAEKNKE